MVKQAILSINKIFRVTLIGTRNDIATRRHRQPLSEWTTGAAPAAASDESASAAVGLGPTDHETGLPSRQPIAGLR